MIVDNQIYKGFWWLPSSPDDQIAGTLTIEPNGKAYLELLGEFRVSNELEAVFERRYAPVIYGRCYAPNSYMKNITLIDCHSATKLNFSSSFPITRFSSRFALIGIHIDSMDNASFFKAHVDFKELAFWCPPKNISTMLSDDSISIRINTSIDDAAPLTTIRLDNGCTLNLRETATYKPDYPALYISQGTFLEILKDEMTGYQVLSINRIFELFLSVATLSSIEHGKITLYSKQVYQEVGDKIYYHPIELVTYLFKNNSQENIKSYDYLFKFKDIADVFMVMLKRIYTNKSIVQILCNLIDSFEKKRVYSSNDFLVVAQALDGFSIRFRKEKGFLPQLTELRNEFRDISRLSLTDDDLKAATGSRHYYSHILRSEIKEAKNAIDGLELYELTKKLRVLLICCVLNFMGMNNEKINHLLNQCNNIILR